MCAGFLPPCRRCSPARRWGGAGEYRGVPRRPAAGRSTGSASGWSARFRTRPGTGAPCWSTGRPPAGIPAGGVPATGIPVGGGAPAGGSCGAATSPTPLRGRRTPTTHGEMRRP
eukprot:scaffold632_cov62-Isochrysis_galbana.AAC.1